MSKNFRQSGLSLTQFLMTCISVAVVAMLLIKVLPEYIVYYKVQSNVRAVAKEANANPSVTVSDINLSLKKRFGIDEIHDVSPEEMDIGKGVNNQVEISFDYDRVVPLFGNLSLVIKFKGSSEN